VLFYAYSQGCRCAPNPGLKLANAFGVFQVSFLSVFIKVQDLLPDESTFEYLFPAWTINYISILRVLPSGESTYFRVALTLTAPSRVSKVAGSLTSDLDCRGNWLRASHLVFCLTPLAS